LHSLHARRQEDHVTFVMIDLLARSSDTSPALDSSSASSAIQRCDRGVHDRSIVATS